MGSVLGAKIAPKSTKMVSKRRLIFHPFSDIRFERFSTRFGSQNDVRNRRFLASEPRSPTLQKHRFPLGFKRIFEFRSSENPSKNGCRTKPVSARVSDPVSGRFSDDFGVPKRSQNGPEPDFSGLRKTNVLRRLWKPARAGERQRSAEVWDYVFGSRSD